jgi:hypothetical protein
MKTESVTKEVKPVGEPAEMKIRRIQAAERWLSKCDGEVALAAAALKVVKDDREEAIVAMRKIITDNQMEIPFNVAGD